ncbi:MAG: hypothetical protein NT166_10000 [Candidatus Aminicenantes bacterium]|nr:hypothetical protein [Candidatus Aminicenantes bacterium]
MLKNSLKQIWSLNSAPQVIKLFGKCCKNYIFETELETTDYRFDLSLCILKSEIDSLLNYWGKNDLKAIFEKSTDWKNIYRFCSEWGDRDSILSKHISDIWFEFDDHELTNLFPGPCLFFSPMHLNRSNIRDKIQNISRLYDTALATLFGDAFTAAIKGNVQRCIKALPKNGAIFQMGAMLPRKLKSVRLCTVMPVNDYPPYLEEIGWRGSFDYLIALLESLARLADGIFVDIDIWEEISPKFGIECVYRKTESLNREQGTSDLQRLLNYLTGLNLCTKDKVEGIMGWINEPLEEHEDGTWLKGCCPISK